ncbi:MAG: SDR family oxidoreductase [Acidimicrobiales bacterium]|nr:SDR family oxidoreductase [Acidimicrobiales bacterium]
MPAVLVTGASTGIGEATARRLATRGHQVFAGVRQAADGERLKAAVCENLVPVLLDVTDEDQVEAAAQMVGQRLGTTRFAGVVNNAGVARGGPLEYLSLEDWRFQFEVNVFGQIAVTRAFMPLIREGHGRVVFVGSISGRYATPLMGPYAGSKFAIEAIAESLRHELHPWGLKVSVVEPGAVKTAIWEKGRKLVDELLDRFPPEAIDRYREMIDQVQAGIEFQDANGIEPVAVARVIEHALFSARPKPRYLVGRDARAAGHLVRFLPDRAKDALIRAVSNRL